MQIPPEICETIISNFLSFGDGDSFDSNLPALARCALVSQEFSSIARPLIFSNVFIREGSDRDVARRKLELLEVAFKCNPSLPSLVRSFTLHTAAYNRDNIKRGDNLYHHPSLPFLLSRFTRLESLVIEVDSRVGSHPKNNIEWRRLPRDLQAAFAQVFDANSQHLKRLGLNKIPGIPLLTWAWKLESLSYLSIGSFMCSRMEDKPEGHPEQLVNGLTRVAPSTVEFFQIPWHPYMDRLMHLYPGFFRKTKHARISTHRTIQLPDTLSVFLRATAETLESLTLDLAIWTGENDLHVAEFPSLCSLTELVLRFHIDHQNLWGEYPSFPRPFLRLCGLFLQNAPKLVRLSFSVVGPCIILSDTPMDAISPLREFDEVFARNATTALRSVRIKVVQICAGSEGCGKCFGFGSLCSERDVREALPSLGSLPATQVEYITERRVVRIE